MIFVCCRESWWNTTTSGRKLRQPLPTDLIDDTNVCRSREILAPHDLLQVISVSSLNSYHRNLGLLRFLIKPGKIGINLYYETEGIC